MTTDPPIDLHALAGELLDTATSQHAGRAGRTLPHPVDGLRQTVIALRAEAELGEHESPGPASLLVLRGRVRESLGRADRAEAQERARSHPSPTPLTSWA